MKKKTRRLKQPTSYKPIRIQNPTAKLHTARLFSRQQIRLILDDPHIWLKNVNKEASFEVKVNSDFLIVEGIAHGKSKTTVVYTISPKYDLSSWADHGEVYLGDIEIKVVDTNGVPSKYYVQIGVIQSASAVGDNNVMTVINPRVNSVKILPHQILEVVCYERDWNDWQPGTTEAAGHKDEWKYDSMPFGDLTMDVVRKEVYGNLGSPVPTRDGVYLLRNRCNFIVNPKLSPTTKEVVEKEIANMRAPIRQHHFWLAFGGETIKKINDLADEVHRCGRFLFVGKCDNKEEICDIYAYVSVVGKHKHKMNDINSVESKLELIARKMNDTTSVITNPLQVEQIDFCQNRSTAVVEIVQPNMFWDDLPDTARWDVEICKKRAVSFVNIQPLPSSHRYGREFQRFQITHCFARSNETKFIGAVNISCRGKEHCHGGVRRLSCYSHPMAARESTAIIIPTKKDMENLRRPLGSCHTRVEPPEGNFYQTGTKYKKPGISEIVLEEIACENLEDGAKTFSAIVVEDSKKNSPSITNFNISPRRTEKESTERKERKSDSTGKPSGGRQSSVKVVHNPKHLSQIRVKYGESIILKMHASNSDLWSLSTESTKLFNVPYFKTVTDNGNLCQEAFVIPVLDEVVVEMGSHHHGIIRLQSTKETIVLFVIIEIGESISEESDYVAPVGYRMIESQNNPKTARESKRKGYNFIKEWQHKDAVLLDLTDTLYIIVPKSNFQWESDKWEIEVKQEKLPTSVLRRLGPAAQQFNLGQLWAQRSMPFMGATLIFKAVADYNAKINEVSSAIAEELDVDKFLIARVFFRNRCHVDNSQYQTDFGEISLRREIEREMGIFLVCRKNQRRTSTTIMLDNPSHNENVDVSTGDTVVVRFDTPLVEVMNNKVVAEWHITKMPEWVTYSGNSRDSKNKQMDFRFKVLNPEVIDGSSLDSFSFCCQSYERKILVNYKK